MGLQLTHILQGCVKKSRPPKPVPVPSGLSKQIHDRSLAIKNCEKALAAAEEAKITGTSKGKRKGAWDEDDVMVFFWGDSRVATERHLKMCKAKREKLEQ
jgi:hypothetical protein